MSVILVPANAQSTTLRLSEQIATIMNLDAIIPPIEDIQHLETPGNVADLHSWIIDQLKNSNPDALIVNLETLTMGGVIQARNADISQAEILDNLKILEKIHYAYPQLKIYAHGVIIRPPSNDVSVEAPDIAKNSEEIQKWGIIQDRADRGDNEAKESAKKTPRYTLKEALESYMNLRERNVKLHENAIKYLDKDIISYLMITLENSQSYGLTAIERRRLEAKISELGLWEKADVLPGCDEVSSIMLSRFALNHTGIKKRPKAYLIYSSLAGPETDLINEDRKLYEVINTQKRAIGLASTPEITNADIIIAINSASKRQADIRTEPNYIDVEGPERYLPDFVDKINEAIDTKKPVVIIDASYANGIDSRLIKLLLKKCDLSKLAGISGWSTGANSIGSGLAIGVTGLFKENPIEVKKLLLDRIVDDWIYHTKIMPELEKKLNCSGTEKLGDKKKQAEEEATNMLKPEVEDLWKAKFEDKLKKNELDYRGVKYPTERLCDPEFDLEIQHNQHKIENEPVVEKASQPEQVKVDTEDLEAKAVSLGAEISIADDIKSAAQGVSNKNIFLAILQKVLLNSIKKVVASNQLDGVPEYVKRGLNGKSTWTRTHFITMLDCSGSMRGVRWTSVKIGYDVFLKKLIGMKNILISAFTFDSKVNPFCKERTADQAIKVYNKMPFSGKGTRYSEAFKYALSIAEKTSHKDYLTCFIMLSDGLGGYPTEYMEKIKLLKKSGRKIIFYTIACATDKNEDADMIQMSTQLGGEHFKVIDAEACRLAFTAILNV